MRWHVGASPGGFALERTISLRYLLVRGPYGHMRNPMYLCGMAIWLGWVIFYGSGAVLASGVVAWGSVTLVVVPWEERALEARFGETYRGYKERVSRWVGTPWR